MSHVVCISVLENNEWFLHRLWLCCMCFVWMIYIVCGKGLGSKHVMCVDDYVECVGRDWEVSM